MDSTDGVRVVEGIAQDQAPVQRGSAPFRPQARLIRLLGEELISDEATALLELVKNAYDADAHEIRVCFQSAPGQSMERIEIWDDGDGMDLETVLSSWLTPAIHRKRGGQCKQLTRLGRFPLGEKGVGRFAADKLGANMELITKARGASQEVTLNVGWHHFEDDVYLDEIESHWEARPPQVFVEDAHGTCIRISHLRARWDRNLMVRAHSAFSRLLSPNADNRDFRIVIESTDHTDLAGIVRNRILDRAPYHLRGRVDSSGVLRLDAATSEQTTVDLRLKDPASFEIVDSALRAPECGPFSITLHAWDLDLAGLRAAGMDRAMRDSLKEWSGVSIYRDGFRVLPYGDRDDDWLELNQRRVNNPTLRLSNNQIVGIIELTQRDNPELRDRTSREGLLDNDAFTDLKRLVLGAVAYLEEHRFGARRVGQKTEVPDEQELDPVLRSLKLLRSRNEIGGSKEALAVMERAYRARVNEFRGREESLLRLAGVGVAAERMVQDFADRLTGAATLVQILRNRSTTLPDADHTLGPLLLQLEGLLGSLDDQLEILQSLRSNSPDGREIIDLRAVIQDALAIFDHRFREAKITVSISDDGIPVFKANYGHMIQVVLALFDNAAYWLRHNTKDESPALRLHLWTARRNGGLIVADNGPGIKPDQSKLIFEPFYSTRREGLGLGLFIVRTILERYQGSITLLDKKLLLPGANLGLQFRLPED